MRIAVCDDDQIFREEIVQLIKEQSDYNTFIDIDVYSSGNEFLEQRSYKKMKLYDIAFLDIMMDGTSGLEVASVLQKDGCIVVLVSSSHHFVTDAFDLQVFQYLYKPVDSVLFAKVFKRCMESYLRKQKCLNVFIDGIEEVLLLDRVVYFESNGRKITAVYDDDERYEFYMKLSELEEQLQVWLLSNFIRVHQSYIVNLDYCIGLQKSNILLKLRNKKKVDISISLRREKKAKESIHRYMQNHI